MNTNRGPYTDITPDKLAILTDRQRQVLLMHDPQGMTFTQIGKELGIHRTAVRIHYNRALLRLDAYDVRADERRYNTRAVELPLNRAELLAIHEGLILLARRQDYQKISNVTSHNEEDWPYKYRILSKIRDRVDRLIRETAPQIKEEQPIFNRRT